MEVAGARWVDRVRHVPFEHERLAPAAEVRVGDRHGGEQRARVRVLRRGVEVAPLRDLDGLPEIHHHHAVRDVADDVEVVRDEDVGEPELLLQVLQEIEDLRLHRDVERGHGLVADDQAGVDRERPGDTDALALAAGELVREAVVVLRVEADDLEQLAHTALSLGRRADPVDVETLGDDEADPLPGVERRVRVLEDHHHLAPERAHLAPREVRDVAALEDDLAARRIEQLHDAARHRGLAAAGLSHDAERLALLQREADAVDGLHGADLLLEEDPPRHGEVLLHLLDDEQIVGHQAVSAITVSLSRATSRAFVSSSRKQRCVCPGS